MDRRSFMGKLTAALGLAAVAPSVVKAIEPEPAAAPSTGRGVVYRNLCFADSVHLPRASEWTGRTITVHDIDGRRRTLLSNGRVWNRIA